MLLAQRLLLAVEAGRCPVSPERERDLKVMNRDYDRMALKRQKASQTPVTSDGEATKREAQTRPNTTSNTTQPPTPPRGEELMTKDLEVTSRKSAPELEVGVTHSPAPWIAAWDDIPHSDMAEGWAINSHAGSVAICDGPANQNEANAHLIAAAPELLEALRFYTAICGNTANTVDRQSASEAWELAQAALAKAEGRP
jgi:hypothetical protein